MSTSESDNWEHYQFTDVNLSDISFLSSKTAYLTTNMVAYNSLSRIDAIKFRRIISTDTISFQAVCFITDSIGYFISKKNEEHSIYRTQSPNTSWTKVFSSNLPLNDIVFTSDSTGYVIGDLGVIFKTTDQGLTWDSLNAVITQNLNSIDYRDNEIIFCAGDSGLVLESINGGASWEPRYLPDSDDLIKIKVLENSQVFVLSNQKNLYSNKYLSQESESFAKKNKYSLYPNPFNNTIHLTNKESGPINLRILTVDGKLTYANEMINISDIKINSSSWKKGIYFLVISTDLEKTTFKLIKN